MKKLYLLLLKLFIKKWKIKNISQLEKCISKKGQLSMHYRKNRNYYKERLNRYIWKLNNYKKN